jgi:hypothetical protein
MGVSESSGGGNGLLEARRSARISRKDKTLMHLIRNK